MPTVHPCGCVCPCDPGREAMTALLRSKKDVEDADEALKIIRNSGASEEEVQVIVARRNAAEQALGAAYKALTDQAAHPKAELDEEEEAVETDVSDTESDDDVSMDVANSSAMSFGDDEDDEDYVP
ncbi:hypothetical protein PHLGIDRAFT_53337, partial [Phlebiopsis gigantea 11061_1 CR5-6]